MIRSIIFDFGNVVGFFDHRRATRQLAPVSRMPESEMLPAIYDTPLEHDFESGKIAPEEFIKRAIEIIGYSGTPGGFEKAFVDIFTPNSMVVDLIPRLVGYRIVLGSNTNELHAARFRCQFEPVLDRFHGLTLSYEIGVRKPEAAFFEHCVRIAGVRADECVFIDDVAANVVGARKAGLTAIHYDSTTDLIAAFTALGIEIDKIS